MTRFERYWLWLVVAVYFFSRADRAVDSMLESGLYVIVGTGCFLYALYRLFVPLQR
jgi:hypothetical protein